MLSSDVLLERADLLLDQGRFKDAEANIRQVLEREPENDHALALLARCFLNSKRFEEGIAIIQQAIALAPYNSFYFYLLAYGHYNQSRLDAALEHLQKALSLYPYQAAYFGLLAYVYIDKRDFEKALAAAEEGLAVEADSTICLNARSTALNKLGRTEAAMETMKDALAQDPDNEMTHATIGWNYLEKGKHKDANRHFLEALRIDPNYQPAKDGLKEALKSNVAPYRWLLQYSFWLHNKGKNFQLAMPFVLYILFRVLVSLFDSNENTAGFTWIIIGVYILFVVSSWTINSIANFFLMFHPMGKHALSGSERWSAITAVSALLAGLLILGTAAVMGLSDNQDAFLAGVVCLSLALPLSRLHFPITIKKLPRNQWYSLALVGCGLLLLLFALLSPALFNVFIYVYLLAFVIYTWTRR